MSGSRKDYGQHSHAKVKKKSLWLSDLPEPILLHILSFLPMKSVVATSLLSRRWQYLWTSAYNLQIDEIWFKGRRSQFMNFTERALLLRDQSRLVSFSLSCSVINDASRINEWITSAIQCNVQQLSLNLKLWSTTGPSTMFLLPCCIFVCATLVKLDMEMYGQIVIITSSTVCLPCLKHLRLKDVAFEDEKSTEKLLSHPLLEELIISQCSWDNLITAVNVNSPNLQSLSIDDSSNRHSVRSSGDCQVFFFGDNLKFFSYEGAFPTQYCISGSTTQLREAQLLAGIAFPENMDVKSKRYFNLVNCLSGVQNLTLSKSAVDTFHQLVEYCPELHTTIPVFERVTQLNLSRQMTTDIYNAQIIFNRCLHLEHLNVRKALDWSIFSRTISSCFRTHLKEILKPIPSCFGTHLKKITVHSYDPVCGDEVDAISIMLNSALVLEEFILRLISFRIISEHSYVVKMLDREIHKRSKISEKCRISVVLVHWTKEK